MHRKKARRSVCSGWPISPRLFCPSANARSQLTRHCLTRRKSSEETCARSPRRAVGVADSMTVVGKKLHVGCEEWEPCQSWQACRSRCRCRETFNEHPPCTCCYDYAKKCGRDFTTDLTTPVAGGEHFGDYDDELCMRRGHTCASEDVLLDDDLQSVCSCEQPSSFLHRLVKAGECTATEAKPVPETLPSSAVIRTCRNSRVENGRLLKLLRKFDTIRQRASAARETCLRRFEMRQKQRLHLIDMAVAGCHCEESGEEVLGDYKAPAPEDDWDAWYDIGRRFGHSGNVNLRDVVALCNTAACDDFLATTGRSPAADNCGCAMHDDEWPPVLDDTDRNEPKEAVISRLMSEFENIRLDGLNARLENQKRFQDKLKQRKYERKSCL